MWSQYPLSALLMTKTEKKRKHTNGTRLYSTSQPDTQADNKQGCHSTSNHHGSHSHRGDGTSSFLRSGLTSSVRRTCSRSWSRHRSSEDHQGPNRWRREGYVPPPLRTPTTMSRATAEDLGWIRRFARGCSAVGLSVWRLEVVGLRTVTLSLAWPSVVETALLEDAGDAGLMGIGDGLFAGVFSRLVTPPSSCFLPCRGGSERQHHLAGSPRVALARPKSRPTFAHWPLLLRTRLAGDWHLRLLLLDDLRRLGGLKKALAMDWRNRKSTNQPGDSPTS